MRARFIGDGATEVCTVFGHDFPEGEWVTVPDSLSKLHTNGMFEVDANADGEPEADVPTLRAQLDELGVKYSHLAGVKRLTELLDQATAPPPAAD